MNRPIALLLVLLAVSCRQAPSGASERAELRERAAVAMKRAALFYRDKVATRGGYVYYYSPDLRKRWGEGDASEHQIWVQPPGTPTVGMALLRAYEATDDEYYLKAATDAATALAYGQLKSGGWTNCIDFHPAGKRSADYRNGKGRGKNNSSLDDGQTQSAILLLINADRAHGFKHAKIHESANMALDALLGAQFPNGGFPQVWTGPVPNQPVAQAAYPDYDWRTEGRIKNYWNMYTLNDNVCGYVAQALIDAYDIYEDERYLQSLRKLGDFLILSQMPPPQPAWAQQYSYAMNPIWARRFEPPGIASDESQEVIQTLMKIFVETGEQRYLEPIADALAYLKRSLLPDGRLSRFYELKTNRPLYMLRRGADYHLTYSDADLPDHYGWKIQSRIEQLTGQWRALATGAAMRTVQSIEVEQINRIIDSLDDDGRWIDTYGGEPLVGQPKFAKGQKYISSERFSQNLTALSEFLMVSSGRPKR